MLNRMAIGPLVLAMSALLPTAAAEEAANAGRTASDDAGIVRQTATAAWTFVGDTASDLGGYLTAPLRFDAMDWAAFAGVVGGSVLVGSLWDNHERDEVQEHRSRRGDAFATNANNAGAIWSVTPLVVLGAWSFVDDDADHHAWRSLCDGTEAIIIASGIITPTIKYVAGRERPDRDLDSNEDWKPFSGNSSFPSGHATQAFAVASVIAAEYRREWWVAPIVYAAAATVGWARMNDNKHYPSDVLAGAAIGTSVGWYVVLRGDDRAHDRGVAVSPVIAHDGTAVQLVWRY